MKNFSITLIFIALTLNLGASPLHSKLKHNIIIDTDCSDSDLRAISILLPHPGITVKAIIISEGELQPKEGMKKIRKLIHAFGADTILAGYGSEPRQTNNLFLKTIESASEQMTVICLGPLTNISEVLKKNQNLYKNIEEIIWYNETVTPFKGFNYDYDSKSAELLFSTGIEIDIISNLNNETPLFDKNMIKQCRQAGEKMAKIIYRIPGLKSPEERPG